MENNYQWNNNPIQVHLNLAINRLSARGELSCRLFVLLLYNRWHVPSYTYHHPTLCPHTANTLCHHTSYYCQTGFLRQMSERIQGFSRHFHSIIQGQFKALLSVDHSIAYSTTGTEEKKTHQFEAFVHNNY